MGRQVSIWRAEGWLGHRWRQPGCGAAWRHARGACKGQGHGQRLGSLPAPCAEHIGCSRRARGGLPMRQRLAAHEESSQGCEAGLLQPAQAAS